MENKYWDKQSKYWITAAIFFTVLATLLWAAPAQGQTAPEENQPEFWCGDNGVKFEPVDTPFIVPAPPEGTTWTLIVLKGGTTNETFSNPLPGTSYSHSAHDNSHIILCYEATTTTTSTTTPTTTLATTTTTTTEPTTTTDPTTTSSSTTTVPDSSTSTSVPTTRTTDPPTTTTTTQPSTLPNTGSDLTPFVLIGMGLLLTGALAVWKLKAD